MSCATFPIMNTWPEYADLRQIPLDMIAPHERQAQLNHCQTLKRLAERGGLCPLEAVAVLSDMDYYFRWPPRVYKEGLLCERMAEAQQELRRLVSEFKSRQPSTLS